MKTFIWFFMSIGHRKLENIYILNFFLKFLLHSRFPVMSDKQTNGWNKHCHHWEAQDRELLPEDNHEQLQTLMPIRRKANDRGTKGRKTLAARPVLIVFRTPAVKCKHGSAELFYLGHVIYTVCVHTFDTWSMLVCF